MKMIEDIIMPGRDCFVPHHGFPVWMKEMFMNKDSRFYNPDHRHLEFAEFGVLFTNSENTTKGRRVAGTAEIFQGRGNKWVKARQEQQITGWFGDIPDFILTFDHALWIEMGTAERFALIEHELYHCAHATDEFGAPRFSQQTGRPVYTIQGHDIEEFIGVVKRYGAKAACIQDMIDAANKKPEIMQADLDALCGT